MARPEDLENSGAQYVISGRGQLVDLNTIMTTAKPAAELNLPRNIRWEHMRGERLWQWLRKHATPIVSNQ